MLIRWRRIDEAAFAHPLEEDIRCLGCGYNLRALKPQGKCPECGFAILKSLHFSEEKVLCLGCMRPNHPLAAHCEFCGAPISGAAAASAYFQTVAGRGECGKPKDQREEEIKPPSPALTFLTQIFGLPIGFIFAVEAIAQWADASPGIAAPFCFCALSWRLFILAFILLIA